MAGIIYPGSTQEFFLNRIDVDAMIEKNTDSEDITHYTLIRLKR